MAAPAGVLLLCLLALSGPYAAVAGGEKATVSVRAVTTISHTDDNFICATLDWWPRDKCNYGMCPWHNSSIINLVTLPNMFICAQLHYRLAHTFNPTDFASELITCRISTALSCTMLSKVK